MFTEPSFRFRVFSHDEILYTQSAQDTETVPTSSRQPLEILDAHLAAQTESIIQESIDPGTGPYTSVKEGEHGTLPIYQAFGKTRRGRHYLLEYMNDSAKGEKTIAIGMSALPEDYDDTDKSNGGRDVATEVETDGDLFSVWALNQMKADPQVSLGACTHKELLDMLDKGFAKIVNPEKEEHMAEGAGERARRKPWRPEVEAYTPRIRPAVTGFLSRRFSKAKKAEKKGSVSESLEAE